MPHFAKSCICCTRQSATAAPETKPSRRCAGDRRRRNLDYFERQHAWMAWGVIFTFGTGGRVHLHAFFVRGQTIIRAHLLHPSPHRRTVS